METDQPSVLDEIAMAELDEKIEMAKRTKNAAIAELARLKRAKIAFTKRPEELKKKRCRSMSIELLRLAPKIRANDQATIRLDYLAKLTGNKLTREELKEYIMENPKMTQITVLDYINSKME